MARILAGQAHLRVQPRGGVALPGQIAPLGIETDHAHRTGALERGAAGPSRRGQRRSVHALRGGAAHDHRDLAAEIQAREVVDAGRGRHQRRAHEHQWRVHRAGPGAPEVDRGLGAEHQRLGAAVANQHDARP